MERYTIQQRVEIVKIYYQNQCSVRLSFRALRPIYGLRGRPAESTIRRLIRKFETTGSVADEAVPVRQRNARSLENIVAVRDSVRENPRQSIPRRAQELGLSATSTWRIMRRDLGLHPYKVQLTQELKPNDHRQRRVFADWALEHLAADPDFGKKIIFSDEAHFWLSGFVNKQNYRIWSDENPREIHQVPLHSEKVTVWCGFWFGGIIGPYFFEDAQGAALTVNGDRYRTMIMNFLWPRMDGMDLTNMWFQQDGATCHTAREKLNLLDEKFEGFVISRGGDINWPPRSCDLTPLDYFLWGYVKSLVYADKPQTIAALKANITRVLQEIGPHLCEDVVQNWSTRMRHLQRSRGGHLAEIIFHT